MAEYSARGSKGFLCKFLELFLCDFPCESQPPQPSSTPQYFSSQLSETTALVGSPHCTVVQKCLQAECQGKCRVHLICFPSFRDHSPALLMSNIHKQLLRIFLLVFLLFMVKSGPSYSNVQKQKFWVCVIEQKEFVYLALADPNTKHQELHREERLAIL